MEKSYFYSTKYSASGELKRKVNYKLICDITVKLIPFDIEFLLIKGLAVDFYYPSNKFRNYVDFDLCFDPHKLDKKFEQEIEIEIRNYNVDIHCGLRHLDSLNWDDIYKESILLELDNCSFRILKPEDHLRVVCTHWLTDGAAYRRRLWDIYYLVKNRPADFDWERCLNVVSPKRRKWIVYTIGLAHRYLGLNLDDTPIAEEAKNLPAWLIKTVESEWESEVKLRPLETCFHDRKLLFQQILKRIPPNQIQATIDSEGDFDKNHRAYYQIQNVFTRLAASIKRNLKYNN